MRITMTSALALATLTFCTGLAQAHESDGAKNAAAGNAKNFLRLGHLMEEIENLAKDGPFIKAFNGTNVTAALNYADKHDVKLPIIITNPSKQSLCILAGANNLKDAKYPSTVQFKSKGTNGMLYVPANSTIEVGNFLPTGTNQQYNGRMQALFGCDHKCEKCPGANEPKHTLVEWEYGTGRRGSSQEHEDSVMWSNLSNVDGFSANVNVTVFNSTLGSCHFRSCNATLKAVKQTCPKANLWNHGSVQGCKSDCKLTGLGKHCCVGEFAERFGLKTCKQSSAFLEKLCPEAYSWPYGDVGQVDLCNGPKAMHAVFTPII